MPTARDYKTERGEADRRFPDGWAGCAGCPRSGRRRRRILKDHVRIRRSRRAGKTVKKRPRGNEPPRRSGDSGGEEPAKSYDFYDMLAEIRGGGAGEGKGRTAGHQIRSGDAPRHLRTAGRLIQELRRRRSRARSTGAARRRDPRCRRCRVDNDTWHRIRIGPISKLDRAQPHAAILRRADIDVLVIRVGD